MNIFSLLNGFREILLNSINHKQYEENNPIQISIYEDKIYVWNDGKFPDEIAEQDLFKKHYSKPYNPLIAQTFFKAGYIESWGRGFEKIKKECEKYGAPLPNIEIKNSGVMVKCVPSKIYIDLLEKMKGKNVPENVPENLTEIEEKIIIIINENFYATQQQMAEKLGVNRKTIQRGLNSLKEKNRIKRIGSDRKGYWKVL